MAYGFARSAQLVHHKIKNYYTRKLSTWNDLRVLASMHCSPQAQTKLEWIIFYHTVAKQNASMTADHFGISHKTLHKWLKRFNDKKVQSLEEDSRAPHKRREWTVTPQEQAQIIALRKQHLVWGKHKLKQIYKQTYGETISTWKIERVIRAYHLFPDKLSHVKQVQKRRRKRKTPKSLISQFDTTSIKPGHLWHVDAIIIYWYGVRNVIFTGIEHFTRLGMARVYTTNSSKNAADFLQRLVTLSDGDMQVVHSDNGSEFAGMFEKACLHLNIQQVYSRVKTPKDNAMLERFNKTVQDEWLAFSEVGLDDVQDANRDLLEWLLEYNDVRPHQSLDYLTPIQYAQQNYFNKVLPMYPASTRA